MKTILFFAKFFIICAAVEDMNADESRASLVKPSGRPLFIHADIPALEKTRPQLEYITNLNQNDFVKPTIDYISTPNEEQTKPGFEYISSRPSGFEYINSYPSYGHNTYPYSPFTQFNYANYPSLPSSGVQTGYQYIASARPSVSLSTQSRPIIKPTTSYPIHQSYWSSPISTGYRYDYGYYPQYLPSLELSYLPIYPLKKK